jgi:hypothetical protein
MANGVSRPNNLPRPKSAGAGCTRRGAADAGSVAALLGASPNRRERRKLRSARAPELVRRLRALIDSVPEDQRDRLRTRVVELLTGWHEPATAELARRAGKEPEISAHGIPDGENDPGWPDGTPEHVRRAAKAPP